MRPVGWESGRNVEEVAKKDWEMDKLEMFNGGEKGIRQPRNSEIWGRRELEIRMREHGGNHFICGILVPG